MSSLTTEDSLVRTAELLNPLVADQFLLYTKVRNYHWNVVGGHFFALHTAFEKVYEDLANDIDELAERMRALGARAPGSMAAFLRYSHLKEENADSSPGQIEMVGNLAADFESVIERMREAVSKIQGEYRDEATAGMLLAQVLKYEKTVWMLKAAVENDN